MMEGRGVKATIIECIMGVFGFGEKNELVDRVLFPKSPEKTAEKLGRIERGELVDEIAALIKKLQRKGYASFRFESSEIARNAREKMNVDVDVESLSEAGELMRGNLGKFAVDIGFAEDAAELRDWTHKVSIELTKTRVKKAIEKRDLVVVQAIQTIDDLDKTLNLFMGRIREWYGIHFPELDRIVDKHETYARLIASLGRREDLTIENLEEKGLSKAKVERITEAAKTSMGAELGEEDLDQIQALCKSVLELYDVRQSMEKYVESVMEEVAPNISTIAGSLIGAKLIAVAGGLRNLAKMPASTIQVLGAEKALFRALRTGTRPPKHGLIFQHNLIHEAKPWQRGKVARGLAGKITIAARVDTFGGNYRGDELKADLEKRLKEIKEKYGKPPPRKPYRRKKRGRRG
ncbi:MAG: C/D box methylation guide ribonucleoprotein complex aNOP56 subunit [Candidatus Bathyarchaeota archaeon]|nr:MAG: C/D box methylation guide ribonucleoprotein complex aNOP56 subunit [Candidatus Bathyarchaeota archaeon]